MKGKYLALAVFCLIVACSACAAAAEVSELVQHGPARQAGLDEEERYSLRPGDKLEIAVYGLDRLSDTLTVNLDGCISLAKDMSLREATDTLTVNLDGCISPALLGEVYVEGKNLAELQKELVTLYSRYLKSPILRVNIVDYGPTRVYVLGEIRNPGLFELKKSRRVMDALGAAHGFKLKSRKKKVYLIRKGTEKPIFVDINRYLRKGDQSQNYELFDGDTLYLTSNHKK